MEREGTKRVLVVANRTAAAPRLLDAVKRRAQAGPCEFALLIPDVSDRKVPDWTLDVALPLLRRAANGPVQGLAGGPEPFEAVQEAMRDGGFEEIIISTLPKQVSKWLRRDLIRRVDPLCVQVTAIVPGGRPSLNETAGPMMDFELRAMTGSRRRFKGPGIGDERPRGE